MKEDNQYLSPEEEKLFKGLEVPFSRSKEALWSEMEARLDEAGPQTRVRSFPGWTFGIAAAVSLLIAATLFAMNYERSVIAPRGHHLSHSLPDGSTIELNADSRLTYTPYWWTFDRSLAFEGEAFFEVARGKTFTVKSQNGITQVLGTSFNISTRDGKYHTLCVTGKVAVINPKDQEEVILTPNEMVSITGSMKKQKLADPSAILAWKYGEVAYDGTPLREIFAEMERQYDIEIIPADEEIGSEVYAGSFKMPEDPGPALAIFIQPFGYKAVQKSSKQFIIQKDMHL